MDWNRVVRRVCRDGKKTNRTRKSAFCHPYSTGLSQNVKRRTLKQILRRQKDVIKMMKAQQFVHMASETKSLSHSRGWVPSKPLMSPFKIRLKDAWEVLKGSAEAVTFGNLEDVDTAARMDDQQERSGTD